MAVSAETKAIIDTLKAEGQAMRDEGNPASLAALNLKFDRFENVLSTISDQIAKQTDAVVDEAASAKDAREKAAMQAELEELKNKKNEETQKKEKTDFAKEIKTAIPNMLKGLQRTLSNFLIGGIGALALGGFVTGIADNLTGGGFSKFIGDFIGGDWDKIRTSLEEGGYNFSGGINKLLDFALRLAPGGDLHDKISGFVDALSPVIDWLAKNPLLGFGLFLSRGLILRGAMKILGGAMTKVGTKLAVGGIAALGAAFGLKKKPNGDLDVDDPKKTKPGDPDAKDKRDLDKAEADKKKAEVEKAKAEKAKAEAEAKKAKADVAKAKSPAAMTDGPVQPKAPRNFDVLPDGSVVSKKTGKPLTGAAKTTALKFNEMDKAAAAASGRPSIDTASADQPKATPRQQGSSSRGKGGGKKLLDAKKIAKANRGKAAKLISKKVAGALLKAVPILGAAAGIWFAATSLAKGDTTTAALEGGSIFLPSLSGVPVDIMAVATSTFYDLYGMPYNQANPEHRVLMKEIGEMVAEEFEKQKEDERRTKEIAYEEGTTEMRVQMQGQAEAASAGTFLGAGFAHGSEINGTQGMTVPTMSGIAKSGATGRMLQSNAEFLKSVGKSQYAKGSRANIEMHEAMAAQKAANGNAAPTVNNTTVIEGSKSVTNKSDQVVQQFGAAGFGDGSDPYNLPGAVKDR